MKTEEDYSGERRLDRRLFNSEPYEMALPTPRMINVAYAYRPILMSVQCIGALFPLTTLLYQTRSSPDLRLPALLTIIYLGVYILRLLPRGNELPGQRWWKAQMLTGAVEIVLLGALSILYYRLWDNHSSFWWALYILPVYRLGETGGFVGWGIGLALSYIAFIVTTAINEPTSYVIWLINGVKAAFLTVSTFTPFYIFRLLDLSRQSARFWYPVSFISGSKESSEGENLLRTIFEKGLDKLIAADRGILWELDTRGGTPNLHSVREYRRDQKVRPPWNRWIYLRKPGITFTEDRILPAESIIYQQSQQASDQWLFADNRQDTPPREPWIICQEDEIRSWLIAPIYSGDSERPAGYIEIGFGWDLSKRDWSGVMKRAAALVEALGSAFNRIHRLQAQQLKETLLRLESQATNETSLYKNAVNAMSEYFRREVLIVEYSLETKKIQSVFGDTDPQKVSWLEDVLHQREENLYQPGNIDFCQLETESQNRERIPECFFACPLPRETTIDVITLADCFEHLSTIDQQILRDSVERLNAILARRRTASLMTSLNDSETRPTRERLNVLAQQIRRLTKADVVVLYEFEAGRPQLPPIIVGRLKDEEYLFNKPIVIEDPNPILAVANAGTPQFRENAQPKESDRKNRHGDEVFVLREGIKSSVGLPLIKEDEVIGVIWVNFRKPKRFDEITRPLFMELFRQLPGRLESIRALAATESLATKRVKDRIRSDLHDRTLQDIIAAGAYLSVVKSNPQIQQFDEALAYLSKASETLNKAEMKTREIMDELEEISEEMDFGQRLTQFARRLEERYGYPEELRSDGISSIPPHLLREGLIFIVEEAMRNAAKHGKANRIVVQASNTDNTLQLVIRDNGVGFDVSAQDSRSGHGLNSMQTRVVLLGGKISIASAKNEGTGIVIEVPIIEEDEEIWIPPLES